MSSSVNKNFGLTQNNDGRDQNNNFNGTFNVNNFNAPESVLAKLTPHVATNALHNAKARANRRACLEGTRGGFIEELGGWIKDPEGNGTVYWVKAGAGVGKTAVAQTLCEKYSPTENSEGLLAAAHFFSRNDASRNSMTSFVPTIAYQLARSPALRPHLADAIDTAILSDPSFMGADWEDQFERLICAPCKRISQELWKTLPRLVIIDGLDECMDVHEPQSTDRHRNTWERDGQSRLLSIIQNSLSAPSPLPLRFLIFSRPEHTISNLLHTDSFPNLQQTDMRELRAEADDDIYLYLCQEFARLVKLRRDAGLDASWPGEEAIQQLTRMSDGHFIYVVTAVKYVMDDNPSSAPQERLDIILSPKSSKYPDLYPLDQLYFQILQPFIDIREQLVLPLLQLIITPLSDEVTNALLNVPNRLYRSRRILGEFLNQPASRHISIVLSRLRSVLYVPDNEHGEGVSVLHASFSDFLGDQRRSHDFYVEAIDDQHYRNKCFQSSLRLLKRIMLRYGNNQEGTGPREPLLLEAWAINAWDTLAVGIANGLWTLESGAEFLHAAVDEFDVYCYVNMLNDRNYIRSLIAFHDGGWSSLIAENIWCLSRAYAFLTRPPSSDVPRHLNNEYLRLAQSKSRHENRPFFRFFREDWVAVLPTQHWEASLQLKLLIGCLWDPTGSWENPTLYCDFDLPFPDGDDSGNVTSLKIFPHDIPPSTLAQSMAIEDCQFWRFGFGPRGAFKFRQVRIAPTANGDHGWITVPFNSSDLNDWMAGFARKRMKRAEEGRAEKRREAMREQGIKSIKKQEATKQQGRQVAVFLRRLLCLNPQLEEDEREMEAREREREWAEFVEEERRYHGVA
ncbi:hypothetical protein V5O48_006642 [Marasmius crinis-equi]|uniref:Nephrocystin 3-like N-terminal domain-containing protein n=1 Tax=Marasmius crinis-equi TaxID=585013 RepID=A0ABR3FJ66_9AGAR